MKYIDHRDHPNGEDYQGLLALSLAELKIIRRIVAKAKVEARHKAKDLREKLGTTGKSDTEYSRLAQMGTALNEAIERISWLNTRRKQGRETSSNAGDVEVNGGNDVR